MKKSLIFAAVIACALQLSALEKHNVEVTYTIKGEVATNFTEKVFDDFSFFADLPLPDGVMQRQVKITGTCGQESHTNCCLTVGLNKYDASYSGATPLKGCVNDAKMMADALKAGGIYDRTQTLIDEEGKKENIRNAIREYAELLSEGDSFLYYHSSHGSDDPVYYICAYDTRYTAEELAEDIALFKDGVKVVVILDACNSGGMFEEKNPAQGFSDAFFAKLTEIKAKNAAPRADVKFSDCLFLCACEKNQDSRDLGENSAFTKGILSFCFSDAADKDKNGLVSFLEVFEKASDFTKDVAKKKQSPVINNASLAQEWYFGHVEDHDGVYSFSLYPEESVLKFYMRKVSQDLKIDISADDAENTFEVKALKAKVNLTGSKEKIIASSMTKINATLVFPFVVENFDKINELPASLILFDMIHIGSGIFTKEQKTKRTFCDVIGNDDLVVSALSVNQKKNQTMLKLKYNYYTDLPTVMEQGTYDMPVWSRIKGENYRKDINVTVTEKSGKSLMLKMNKKK